MRIDYLEGKNSANVTEKTDEVISDLVLEKDPGITLFALVTDAATKKPLEAVDVTIVDLKDSSFDDYITPSNGEHRKPLINNKVGDKLTYKLKLEKSGYLTKEVFFNHEITKLGEIAVHQALDLSMGKIEVGGDLAKMIGIEEPAQHLTRNYLIIEQRHLRHT